MASVAMLLIAGCLGGNSASDAGFQETSSGAPVSMMDREYPYSISWSGGVPDHSYIAAEISVPERTEWRVWHNVESGVVDVPVWWMTSVFIEGIDGHRMIKGTGSTNSFPVCELGRSGAVFEECEPATFREDMWGARARTAEEGTHLFFAVMYGGNQTTALEIEVSSDHSVKFNDLGTGTSELLILDDGVDDLYVDATVHYYAERPILGNFHGIRASFSEFVATHESGLSFQYHKGTFHGRGEWYDRGEPVMSRVFSGPAGNWTFTARGERAPDSLSSPVVGLLLDPFFVNEDGTMRGTY